MLGKYNLKNHSSIVGMVFNKGLKVILDKRDTCTH